MTTKKQYDNMLEKIRPVEVITVMEERTYPMSKISAIKIYRELTGAGLCTAKNWVERFIPHLR